MQVIGLTGKTGAGKSTVALMLKERGCFLIDGDKIAREILLPGMPALRELADFFGEDIILENGSLDRRLLARRAFSSEEATAMLNRITHPHITERFCTAIRQAEKEGYPAAIIDAAALLESDCRRLCEKILVVTAPEELRLGRILQRDGLDTEAAQQRIRAQKSDEYYLSKADAVIRSHEPYELEKELTSALEKAGISL